MRSIYWFSLCALLLFAEFPAAQGADYPKPKEVAGSNSEESAWSPDGTKIAFDGSFNDKFYNLYVRDFASGKLKRLTETRANDITPAWSPDGRQIAFTSDRTGKNEIYVMNAERGPATQVTRDQSDSIHASWSPDGRELIYCSSRMNPDQKNAAEGEVYDIFTIRPDGTGQKRITKNGGINTYPHFSPDGKKVVYRRVLGERNSEVWLMNADGSDAKNLTNDPSFDGWPFWSPDGKQVVFASNRRSNGQDYDIYIMDADGSNLRRITDVRGRNTSPKWAPDGNKITFDQSLQMKVHIVSVELPPVH